MEPYPRPATGPAPHRPRVLGSFSWTLTAVLIVITGYYGLAAYRLKDDQAIATNMTTSFSLFLVLLLCCLLLPKERTAAGSGSRKWLKAFVRALAALLYFHFVYMVMGAAALTLRVALLLWFVPVAAWAGTFVYAFFHRDRVYQPPDETMLRARV